MTPDTPGAPDPITCELARRLLAEYCRAVDAMDAPAIGRVFAPVGRLRNAAGEFSGTTEIEAFFGALFERERPTGAQTKHLVTNVMSTSVDGGIEIDCSFQFLHRTADQLLMAWGQYAAVARRAGNRLVLDTLQITVETPFMVLPYNLRGQEA